MIRYQMEGGRGGKRDSEEHGAQKGLKWGCGVWGCTQHYERPVGNKEISR